MIRKLKFLRGMNIVFEIAIFILAINLIFAPLFPVVAQVFNKNDKSVVLATGVGANEHFTDLPIEGNYLVIPSIGVKREIVEALGISTVHENIWRRNEGSTPPGGGNTVLVAHRYATIGGNRASTFYRLPELVAGEKIYVRYEGIIYIYEINNTFVVLPTQVEIEGPSTTPVLTLYTCTPLWKADHRFVVTAPLQETIL